MQEGMQLGKRRVAACKVESSSGRFEEKKLCRRGHYHSRESRHQEKEDIIVEEKAPSIMRRNCRISLASIE